MSRNSFNFNSTNPSHFNINRAEPRHNWSSPTPNHFPASLNSLKLKFLLVAPMLISPTTAHEHNPIDLRAPTDNSLQLSRLLVADVDNLPSNIPSVSPDTNAAQLNYLPEYDTESEDSITDLFTTIEELQTELALLKERLEAADEKADNAKNIAWVGYAIGAIGLLLGLYNTSQLNKLSES